jgi:hypothetical protein
MRVPAQHGSGPRIRLARQSRGFAVPRRQGRRDDDQDATLLRARLLRRVKAVVTDPMR